MRALPAGPTVTDMLANAALLIGLSRWLAEQDEHWTRTLSFERAEHGFYRAAQHGLAAELSWPFGHDRRWPPTWPLAGPSGLTPSPGWPTGVSGSTACKG
jgi:hypothetical protein